MPTDIDKLMKILLFEEFNGKSFTWKKDNWAEMEVFSVENKNKWFYQKGNIIYVQPKKHPNRPYCFGCDSDLNVKELMKNEELKSIVYCPKCEKEPN